MIEGVVKFMDSFSKLVDGQNGNGSDGKKEDIGVV